MYILVSSRDHNHLNQRPTAAAIRMHSLENWGRGWRVGVQVKNEMDLGYVDKNMLEDLVKTAGLNPIQVRGEGMAIRRGLVCFLGSPPIQFRICWALGFVNHGWLTGIDTNMQSACWEGRDSARKFARTFRIT